MEWYNRILAEEFVYARTRTPEQQRSNAVGVWNAHHNYHRPIKVSVNGKKDILGLGAWIDR